MLLFEQIKIGSIWYSHINPVFKVIVVDVAPRIVGKGGWVSYRPVNDSHQRVMEEDSWKFQIAFEPEVNNDGQ